MVEDVSFRDFIDKVRSGDGQAAADLVRRYEPTIRRLIRARLTDPHLRRLLDSVDICQSVLGSFFIRAASGQYDLDEPRQLLNLLAAMARNKLFHQVEKQRAARRDCRRQENEVDEAAFVDPNPSPGHVVAGAELLELFRSRLTDEERALADRRARGLTWAEIAAEIGGDKDALRIKFTRAVDRVTQELGLEE
jgi:RNA polymerase sigma-70 factor (ECF subfamily)